MFDILYNIINFAEYVVVGIGKRACQKQVIIIWLSTTNYKEKHSKTIVSNILYFVL